jgi:hypothetical protein
MLVRVVVQGDGSMVTVEPGLIGGEVNRILAAHQKKNKLPIQYKIGPDPSSIDRYALALLLYGVPAHCLTRSSRRAVTCSLCGAVPWRSTAEQDRARAAWQARQQPFSRSARSDTLRTAGLRNLLTRLADRMPAPCLPAAA